MLYKVVLYVRDDDVYAIQSSCVRDGEVCAIQDRYLLRDGEVYVIHGRYLCT